uniref:Uncharacterized protein n=1 Tax=Panagrolaimus sp. JU765 TaxID=591449 RepID=A0AC34QJL4_9BILA
MVEISHDYLNTVGLADQDFAEFLKKNEANLENSFVILFSDHGNRYDTIRETVIGRLESRLPVLSVRVPKWFEKKFPDYFQALKSNSKKMTSHFDVFATLMHVLDGLHKPPPKVERGISLFSEIAENRTCFEAKIPNVFCPCFNEISLEPSEGVEYAEFLLNFIKDYFTEHQVQEKCAPMKLKSVKSVLLSLPPSKLAIDDRQPHLRSLVLQYRVQFTVQPPSNALLEGVVFKDQRTGKLSISNDLDRNNKYGNSSFCVSDRLLKKLCHCL